MRERSCRFDTAIELPTGFLTQSGTLALPVGISIEEKPEFQKNKLDANCMGVIKQWNVGSTRQSMDVGSDTMNRICQGKNRVGWMMAGCLLGAVGMFGSDLVLDRAASGLSLRLGEGAPVASPLLEPQFQVERSFDLQVWEPVGELSRGSRNLPTLEVDSQGAAVGFFRAIRLPLDLGGADLSGLDLVGADLAGANLAGADLRYADLSGADLRRSDLSNADLRGADLRAALLEGANLAGTSLSGANLIGVDVSGFGEGTEGLEGAVQFIPEPRVEIEIGDIDVAAPFPPSIPPPPLAAPAPAFDAALGGGGAAPVSNSANLGFAVGGANDIGNFRQNIENEFLPIFTDITYEGLFFDYFFDTGQTEPCEALFCPSYSQAVTLDPLSEREERYLSVGLNSGISEAGFQRKQLNLTIVMDVSGSMNSPFNRFYYDGSVGRQVELTDEESALLKIDVAIEAVTALLDHLEPEDRIGIVTFNSESRVVQPLSRVQDLDMDEVRRRVIRLRAFSGTNMSAGMATATRQYDALLEVDPTVSENRIIFVTDAMPNQGETSRGGLIDRIEVNAANRLYSTVIGVGVDFNTDLIESITKNRGANYHSVHSPAQFIERMDEGFDFMVTPLVFDLRLGIQGEGWSIDRVFGSPEADEATGEVFRVNTLFPSRTVDGETRGGLILVKLSRNSEVENEELKLTASYENRVGEQFETESVVTFVNPDVQHFDNTGIRKGILLTRYASLLKDWIFDERLSYEEERPIILPLVDYEWGIPLPPIWPGPRLGEWERRSMPLFVSHRYREIFGQFRDYFAAEAGELGDEDLQQELKVLDRLADDPAIEPIPEEPGEIELPPLPPIPPVEALPEGSDG